MATRSLQRIRSVLFALLFADLTALAARISVPVPPVPLTLQTAMVLLSGALLGSRHGAAAQVIYVAMGLAGLPVFAAGGGPSYLLSPTFGYLAGFIGGAWLTGRLLEFHASWRMADIVVAMLAGLAAIYVIGVPYLWLNIRLVQGREMNIGTALKVGLLLPLPGDLVKLAVAAPVARSLAPLVRRFAARDARC